MSGAAESNKARNKCWLCSYKIWVSFTSGRGCQQSLGNAWCLHKISTKTRFFLFLSSVVEPITVSKRKPHTQVQALEKNQNSNALVHGYLGMSSESSVSGGGISRNVFNGIFGEFFNSLKFWKSRGCRVEGIWPTLQRLLPFAFSTIWQSTSSKSINNG